MYRPNCIVFHEAMSVIYLISRRQSRGAKLVLLKVCSKLLV